MQDWGFTTEEHFLTTEDGYIINVARGFLNTSENRKSVLLAHGVFSNGMGFVIFDENSLGRYR